MATVATLHCFSCGTELVFSLGVGRREECEFCGADVHVCRNCRFYDRGAYNECRESSAEVVREKERANFCDYFEPGNFGQSKTSADQLREAAESLFKKKD